ncbi:MAG: polysaccharide deacetylase family protein [candidate division Zixibacteria bacterium]|nr:polysaccharide deacetylase family protein [candidate division Zixibacteria bacterium]
MKSVIKFFLFRIAYYLGFWRLVYLVSSAMTEKKFLVVFTYHRIADSKQTAGYYLGYDRGLDKEDFKAQIESIIKYFDIIDLDKYIDVLTGEANLKKHSALITFDDADSEFIDHAQPVLEKAGCPSVVFTPTGYIDTDMRFWHLLVSNSFNKMTSDLWAKIGNDTDNVPEKIKVLLQRELPIDERGKAGLCQNIVNELNNYKHPIIDDIVDRFEKATGKEYDLGIRCLSWDDHRTLAGQGVRFESHGVSHNKLEELEPTEVEKEFIESKHELEKQLDTTVTSICYPAGSFNDSVVEQARKAGYEIGFTTQPGISDYPLSGSDLYTLPRLSIYGDDKYEINFYLGKILIKMVLHGRI